MADLLVDTDVFVDHLRGTRALRSSQDARFYSVVTRAELFAGRGTEEDRVVRLLSAFTEVPIDRAIAERAGRLRRTGSIRLADALVAATALDRGLDLVTRNRQDFEGVAGLRVRAPE